MQTNLQINPMSNQNLYQVLKLTFVLSNAGVLKADAGRVTTADAGRFFIAELSDL